MKIDTGHWKDWEVYLIDEDGARLPEHKIEHTPPSSATTAGLVTFHVECKHGQAFKIGTSRLSPAAFDCRIDYTVDGRKVEGVAFLKDSVRPVEKGSIPENMNGVPYMRRMVFTQMQMVENGPQLDVETAAEMGKISVRLTAGICTPSERKRPPHTTPPAMSVIDERTKKALIGTVVGGELESAPAVHQDTYSMTYVHKHIPRYKIVISYGTAGHLLASGVIEKNDPRQDSESDSESNDVKPKLKRRHSDDKPQRWSKRNKEVIDLTGDD